MPYLLEMNFWASLAILKSYTGQILEFSSYTGLYSYLRLQIWLNCFATIKFPV